MIASRLFPFRRPLDQPRARLLCFPYAGGAASLYRLWPALLGPAVDVCPVELPGRGVRGDEPACRDMAILCAELAQAIEPMLDGTPVALFGHSMGARIAFELAHRFDGRIARLFASGSPAPGTRPRYGPSGDRRPTAGLSDGEFKHRLRALGGTPAVILDDDDVMAHVMPVVRADLVLTESYRVEPHTQVACPITVFSGRADPDASPIAAATWQSRTTRAFRMIEVDAGHFFLDSHRGVLIHEIARELAPDAR